MKRLTLTLTLILASLTMVAQNISYENMVRLMCCMNSANARIEAEKWGYKQGYKSSKDSDFDTATFCWGAAKCNGGKVITNDKEPWAHITVAYSNVFNTVVWSFPDAKVVEELKKSMDANGWKFTGEVEMDDSMSSIFRKENTEDYFSLSVNKDGTFDFSFNWFNTTEVEESLESIQLAQ